MRPVARPRLNGAPLQAVLAAVNHVLAQQPWAGERIAAFAGRSIRLACERDVAAAPLLPDLHTRIGEDGLLHATVDEAPVAVTLWLRPSVAALFDGLTGGARALAGHSRVEGEGGLAAALGEIAHGLRYDAEEDLSRVTGDLVAHRLFSDARTLGERLTRLRDDSASALGQYLTTDAAQLVESRELAVFAQELSALAERIDRLDRRLTRLRRGADH